MFINMMYNYFSHYSMINSEHIEENNFIDNPDMLPVILTCPHDGDFVPSGVDIREISKSPSKCATNFVLTGDDHTTALTNEIADNIFGLCQKNVYVEIGIIKRNRCDLNRSPECAYQALPAQLCY